ncbi:ATP synthase subunit gamma [Burkholderia aenigmatica]|uniref:ATP synthase subunit gamma n=2 Tax=Burkholderia TaxID=32008 RepID=A0ABY6XSI0_9BURK|nr:FoF1 ATP synthase subunit gamma [Burkholderia aenigmatica]VWC73945.1 ATP synthase subunit gamma [Burkholderia aenigmatica]VWD59782.1 ATP synthase subunit gamma [Burkholderia aenigmatica]
MSDKLTAAEARAETARQLQSVIGAMRGVAATRARDAQARLPGVRACAAIIGAAIGAVLSADATRPGGGTAGAAAKPHVVIVLCSEQGFVGAYNAQILDQARRCGEAAHYLLIGSRGAALAEACGLSVTWTAPMASRADDVVTLAGRLTDALFAHLAASGAEIVSIVHAMPGSARLDVVEHRLLPFDYSRFDTAPRTLPPLLNLPPDRVLADLAQAYAFVELCEATMLAFAAENEARTRAMIAARANIEHKLAELLQTCRLARQDEITADILELAAGIDP